MDAQDERDDSRLGLGSCQKQDLRDFVIGQDWEGFIRERFQSW